MQELLEFLSIAQVLSDFPGAHVKRVAVTPDFHKGAGIPVGTVMQTSGFMLPQAIGNDIGCGMRLHTTSVSHDELKPHLDDLENTLRAVFFEGRRNIPLNGRQRESILLHGVNGLTDSIPASQQEGLWRLFHEYPDARQPEFIESNGSLPVQDLPGQLDWLGDCTRLSRDAQVGSLGGGNHFVELQYVHRIHDPHTAYAWGLKPGLVTIMVHSGSLGFGHLFGNLVLELARQVYPAHLPAPGNGFFPVQTDSPFLPVIRDALNAAANFAFVNRLFLALMTASALKQHLGALVFPLLYDAPHNFIWPGRAGQWLHRKGATPARGFNAMQGTPFAFTGEPVLVPGSMGASSFILAGRGLPEALESASHGAGRVRSRGAAMHGHDAEFQAFLRDFRVVTPLDWKRARADIRQQKLNELKQEAPFAYKGIGPVIQTLESSGIAANVAELRPLLTIKG